MNKYLIKLIYPDGKDTFITRYAKTEKEAIEQATPVKIEVEDVIKNKEDAE